jgi:hypothetical protein
MTYVTAAIHSYKKVATNIANEQIEHANLYTQPGVSDQLDLADRLMLLAACTTYLPTGSSQTPTMRQQSIDVSNTSRETVAMSVSTMYDA